MSPLRYTIFLLYYVLSTCAVNAQESDNLRLFAYQPNCTDFVLGYSVDLMAEGRLVGHPERSCALRVDYDGCATTLCKVNRQLRQWQICVAEKAKEKLEATCSWNSETATLDAPVGSVSDAPIGSGPIAERCFRDASLALRERMTILLSPSIPPEEQLAALAFNDQLITSLKTHEGETSNILCGHHMNIGSSFPDLPTAKSLRIALLSSRAAIENREDLFALLRLSFETHRAEINLSREQWFACLTDLEVAHFVFGTPLDDLISGLNSTCKLFQDEATKDLALEDFEEMKS